MAKRWYFKDNKFFRNPLVVGDKQIVNPTHEQLIAEGWLTADEYEPIREHGGRWR